jgi:hypothetical protein
MATEMDVEINERGSRIFITDPIKNPKNLHVLIYPKFDENDNEIGDCWVVYREGQKGNIAALPTKDEAIDEAKKIKMPDDVIIVHKINGQLECKIQ